jgi:hypothetical protein
MTILNSDKFVLQKFGHFKKSTFFSCNFNFQPAFNCLLLDKSQYFYYYRHRFQRDFFAKAKPLNITTLTTPGMRKTQILQTNKIIRIETYRPQLLRGFYVQKTLHTMLYIFSVTPFRSKVFLPAFLLGKKAGLLSLNK